MSIESMAVVLHHSPSQGSEKLVLLGIANHDGDGGAWPSRRTLARYANINIKGVQRHLRALEAGGQIRTHTSEGGLRRTREYERPNLYEVLVRCPDGCDGSTSHRMKNGGDHLWSPVGGVSEDPGSEMTPPGGSHKTPGGGSHKTPEPSLEPSGKPSLEMDPSQQQQGYVPREPETHAAAAKNSPTSNHRNRDASRAADPTQILDDAMLNPDEQNAFRAWLREHRGSTNPDGLIVNMHAAGALSDRIIDWRAHTPTHAPTTSQTPNTPAPAWCGLCDPTTRILTAINPDGSEQIRRCPDCHPRAGRPMSIASAAIGDDWRQTAATPDAGHQERQAIREKLPTGTPRRNPTQATATHPTQVDDSAYREAQAFFEHMPQSDWDKWVDAALTDRPNITGSALVIHAAHLARQDRRNQR